MAAAIGEVEIRVVRLRDGEGLTHYENPPFALEVTSDGQRVRLESPTLDGLLELRDLFECATGPDMPPFITPSKFTGAEG